MARVCTEEAGQCRGSVEEHQASLGWWCRCGVQAQCAVQVTWLIPLPERTTQEYRTNGRHAWWWGNTAWCRCAGCITLPGNVVLPGAFSVQWCAVWHAREVVVAIVVGTAPPQSAPPTCSSKPDPVHHHIQAGKMCRLHAWWRGRQAGSSTVCRCVAITVCEVCSRRIICLQMSGQVAGRQVVVWQVVCSGKVWGSRNGREAWGWWGLGAGGEVGQWWGR